MRPVSSPVSPPPHPAGSRPSRKPVNATLHRPPLAPARSVQLRDQLLAEIATLSDGEALALWAQRRMADKNTLTADDAGSIEAACARLLGSWDAPGEPTSSHRDAPTSAPDTAERPASPNEPPAAEPVSAAANRSDRPPSPPITVTPRPKPVRRRNKAHLAFVATQPCLVCQRTPCDAHHLKFAQPKALGRKVSDEFTVPLCRAHHNDLHRHHNEPAWWANLKIAPLPLARALWISSTGDPGDAQTDNPPDAAAVSRLAVAS